MAIDLQPLTDALTAIKESVSGGELRIETNLSAEQMAEVNTMEWQRWRLFGYDLLPDGTGGVYVNDRYGMGVTAFLVPVGGLPNALQLNSAAGIVQPVEWEGGESFLYADDENGDPLCEFVREVD